MQANDFNQYQAPVVEVDLTDEDSLVDGGSTDIAIIGMSGRFPGAPNLAKFWQNLCDGVESVTFFSDEELLAAGVSPDWLRDPNYIKAAPVLSDIDLFDAAFFGYSPREATLTDPQQRLFLESCWEGLENAGYDAQNYPGPIGVFAGTGLSSYLLVNILSNHRVVESTDFHQFTLGNDKDFLSSRVSYKLNLRGPSISVQTACSTGLVATHLACQSLLNFQCDMALAGSVNLRPPTGYAYQEGNVFSPDGHCRPFDARAAGTVFGSGVGVVVLKRLAEALAEGDHILAVIKGSAVNNDGSQKVGYTAPSVDGQAEVIAMAQAVAGVAPHTIGLIEAHGTGTALGDPIEVAALTQVFQADTEAKSFCAIGSVKSNLGHLDAAAGMAGLIKAVLALKNRQLPPSLHFETPNPKIDFENSPFFVNTRLTSWSAGNNPRRAGVSSFGMGGTNAHVVLEEAPVLVPQSASGSDPASRPAVLLTLSARSEAALDQATSQLLNHLQQQPDLDLADVAYTLQTGRKAFRYRRTLVCQNQADAIAILGNPKDVRSSTGKAGVGQPRVVFMFPGQGSQYTGMAQELYETEAVFRDEVDRQVALLEPHLGLDLREVIYPTKDKAAAMSEQLKQTWLTQPALFVIEYALARLWQSWGIQPQAMVGHSVGEFVAACLAGVFRLEDALMLVAARGRLMQQLPHGAMVSVSLSEQALQPYLTGDLWIAAVNTPTLCVVSGTIEAVEGLKKGLAEGGIDFSSLYTSHAFHSALMDPVLGQFGQLLAGVERHAPSMPFLSNLSGDWITDEEALDPIYWAKHIRQTVRFSDAMGVVLREPDWVCIEVGPGQALCSLVKRQPARSAEQQVIPSTRHPHNQQSDFGFLLGALGRLWEAGVTPDWKLFYQTETRHRLPLPTYPFERQRFWLEPARSPDLAPVTATPAEPKALPATGSLSFQSGTTGPRLSARPTSAALQRIIMEQVEVMSRQLDVWRKHP